MSNGKIACATKRHGVGPCLVGSAHSHRGFARPRDARAGLCRATSFEKTGDWNQGEATEDGTKGLTVATGTSWRLRIALTPRTRNRVVQPPMPALLILYEADQFTVPTSAVVVASRAQRPMPYVPRVVGLHSKVVALLQSRATVQLTPSKMNHLN